MGDQPTPAHDPHAALAAVAGPWLSGHHSGPNAGLADALRTWFDALGTAVPEGVSLLFGCSRDECAGHEDSHSAILHSLHSLADGQVSIRRDLRAVLTKEGTIMTDVATVAADFDKYKTDVSAAFARLQASVDAGNTDAQALADLDAAINGADADANAEDPAPVVEPTEPTTGDEGDGSTDGDTTPDSE